jgi:Tol biopolymer transport system component
VLSVGASSLRKEVRFFSSWRASESPGGCFQSVVLRDWLGNSSRLHTPCRPERRPGAESASKLPVLRWERSASRKSASRKSASRKSASRKCSLSALCWVCGTCETANGRFSNMFAGKDSKMAIAPKFRLSAALRVTFLLFLLLAHSSYGGDASIQVGSLALSPDGKFIAVDVKEGSMSFIYKVAADSGIATRLTNATTGKETSPAFSPDGKRIAYVYWPGKGARSRIVMVDVDGLNPRQWSLSAVTDSSPVFSPDNKTIVFSRAELYGNDSPIAQPHAHAWKFYACDLDGRNIREITTESFYMVSPPSISPDGRSMVVVTEGLETNRQIAIYSLVEPGPPTLTLQPHVPKEADHKNPIMAYPNFVPDGSVLFMAASNGKHGYDYDIYRVTVRTGTLEKLTNGNGYATDLKVSADGRTAAFLKWRKNWSGDLVSSQVYLLDLQSRETKPLNISGLR